MRALWRKEEWVLGFLYFWAGSCYTFFLDLCDYSDKIPKMFCSSCGANALQPQISVINVVATQLSQVLVRRQVPNRTKNETLNPSKRSDQWYFFYINEKKQGCLKRERNVCCFTHYFEKQCLYSSGLYKLWLPETTWSQLKYEEKWSRVYAIVKHCTSGTERLVRSHHDL